MKVHMRDEWAIKTYKTFKKRRNDSGLHATNEKLKLQAEKAIDRLPIGRANSTPLKKGVEDKPLTLSDLGLVDFNPGPEEEA